MEQVKYFFKDAQKWEQGNKSLLIQNILINFTSAVEIDNSNQNQAKG